MKKLSAVTLLDVLPESILLDPKLKASAQALDAQFQAVTAAVREVLHLPRLGELSGNVLDYLAEQFHLDFYEPLYLTEDEKRNLIRESIAWHRIKGTPAAVEQIAHNAFRDAEIVEWFDYPEGDGKPYHIKIRSHGFKDTPDGWDTYTRMINVAKNVRSWIDNYELIIDGDEHKLNLFAGMVNLLKGSRTIEPARPPTDYKNQTFAGMANFVYGQKIEFPRQPKTKFEAQIFAAQILKRVGTIRINSDTQAHGDDHFWRSWTSIVHAGTVNLIHGKKVWSLARPKNPVTNLHAGIADVKSGSVTIDFERKKRISQNLNLHAGIAEVKTGTVKIDTDTPHGDDNIFHKTWTARTCAGVAELKTGSVTIRDSSRRNVRGKVVVHIGQVLKRVGYITIKPADSDFPDMPSGDWLGLRFRFPNLSKRIITLPNPRDNLVKQDIRDVGDRAAETKILLNSAGEATTGIDLAMLTTRSVRKIF